MNYRQILVTISLWVLPLAAQDFDISAPREQVLLHSFPLEIPDDSAVVLKKGNAIGIVFLSEQSNDPEKCTFHWLLRTDGQIDFSPNAKRIQEGHQKDAKSVEFGPFKLEWSVARPGKGYVYFPGDDSYMGVMLDANRETISGRLAFTTLIRNVRGDTTLLKSFFLPK